MSLPKVCEKRRPLWGKGPFGTRNRLTIVFGVVVAGMGKEDVNDQEFRGRRGSGSQVMQHPVVIHGCQRPVILQRRAHSLCA